MFILGEVSHNFCSVWTAEVQLYDVTFLGFVGNGHFSYFALLFEILKLFITSALFLLLLLAALLGYL